ncbi:MAG: DMT family transporter [Hydrogenophaga sp.]|nr:DMT family transporter [Hydrogenophaga sp.]
MVLVALLWSMAGVVSRQFEAVGRFEAAFWRSAFTALSLLLLLPLWRARQRRQLPSAGRPASPVAWWQVFERHWGLVLDSGSFWICGLCWGVMFTALMLALTLTSVANVLVVLSVGPLLTALLARLLIGQRLAWRTWLAVLLAGLGIAYMFGSQWLQPAAAPAVSDHKLLLGSLVAFCVPLAGAVNWTVVQRAQIQGQTIDLVPAVLLGALLSTLLTLPLALPWAATRSDLAWLAFLGLFQLAIPCVLAVICARVLKASEVSLLSLLEVIFGIFLAWLWANETPANPVLLGGSVVVSALVLNEWLGWRQRAKQP